MKTSLKSHSLAALAALALGAGPAAASDLVLQFSDIGWPDRPSTYTLMGWCNPANNYVPAADCGYGGLSGAAIGSDSEITLQQPVWAWRETSPYDRYVLFGQPGSPEAVFRVLFDFPPASGGGGAPTYVEATLTMSLFTGSGVIDYVAALPTAAQQVGEFALMRNEPLYFMEVACPPGLRCGGNLFETWGSADGGGTAFERDGPMFDITALPVGLAVLFVPEPTSSALAVAALLALGGGRRRGAGK